MKNLIFLDIDGVLNYTDWYTSPRNCQVEQDLDPFCIERINHLARLGNAYIVISSDWRISMQQCRSRLEKSGCDAIIIDSTPSFLFDPSIVDKSRGSEIQQFLDENPYYDNYVIIDDRTDMLASQLDNFVHIDSKVGFTDNNLKDAINILKRK